MVKQASSDPELPDHLLDTSKYPTDLWLGQINYTTSLPIPTPLSI
jgi:hypothetical protein